MKNFVFITCINKHENHVLSFLNFYDHDEAYDLLREIDSYQEMVQQNVYLYTVMNSSTNKDDQFD